VLVWQSHGGARDNGVTNLGKITYGFLQTWVYAVIDSGDRTFLQRGSPTPTSLASVARITFFLQVIPGTSAKENEFLKPYNNRA
jgi:hypothetical protein